ncbi:hypothetical protein ScPMuIL_004082 [Solemya velum]
MSNWCDEIQEINTISFVSLCTTSTQRREFKVMDPRNGRHFPGLPEERDNEATGYFRQERGNGAINRVRLVRSTEPPIIESEFGERPKRPGTRRPNAPTAQRGRQLGPTNPEGYRSQPQQQPPTQNLPRLRVPVLPGIPHDRRYLEPVAPVISSGVRNYFPLRDAHIISTARGLPPLRNNNNNLERNGVTGVRIVPSLPRAHIAAHNEGPVPMVCPSNRNNRSTARNVQGVPTVQGFPVLRTLGVPAQAPLIAQDVIGAAHNGVNPPVSFQALRVRNNNATAQNIHTAGRSSQPAAGRSSQPAAGRSSQPAAGRSSQPPVSRNVHLAADWVNQNTAGRAVQAIAGRGVQATARRSTQPVARDYFAPPNRPVPAYLQDRPSRQIPAAPRDAAAPRRDPNVPSQADIVRALAAQMNVSAPGDDAYANLPNAQAPAPVPVPAPAPQHQPRRRMAANIAEADEAAAYIDDFLDGFERDPPGHGM